jgi:sterol desaturase/sphingolipid hydroxylase (fatty acid hydroxylase superfamily)
MDFRAPYSPPPPARKPRYQPKFPRIPVMTIRTRKFLGAIALLVLAAVWALTMMAVAQMPWLASSGWRQAIFYVVAGMGWVLPAMPIVTWMSRPDV